MTYLNIQAVNPKLNKNLSVGDLVNRLLCYRQTIINLKTRGYNWARYDRKFRKYIETAKEPLFQYRMHDLAETCANTQSDRESFPSRFQKGRGRQFSTSHRACIDFQKGKCTYGATCKYQHRCGKAADKIMGIGTARSRGENITKLPTPVKIEEFSRFMEGMDNEKFDFVLEGFTTGFRLGFEGKRPVKEPSNLKSALDNPEITQAKIDREVQAGRQGGPYAEPPMKG